MFITGIHSIVKGSERRHETHTYIAEVTYLLSKEYAILIKQWEAIAT